MLAYVKRTTIKISDELDAQLRAEARRRGLTLSALTREVLEQHVAHTDGRLSFAKVGRSGHTDTARRADEILREGFGRS
jgi:predicted DNA-binding protein